MSDQSPTPQPAPEQAPPGSRTTTATATAPPQDHGFKETIISLLISFVMALVFRSYVIEAFVIPTGSMAPTLLGQHMLYRSSQTGYEWTVNPWHLAPGDIPFPVQGAGQRGNEAKPVVTDPMTYSESSTNLGRSPNSTGFRGHPEGNIPKPIRSGDRILVQKYLYELFEPERYDVIVFKNPETATQNYIKRLVGLPNEQIFLVDGDVFARPVSFDADNNPVPQGDWQIQRKHRRAQSALWRTLFSSEFTPLNTQRNGRAWFIDPWRGPAWSRPDRVSYRTDESSSILAWDHVDWPITDWNPYNEIPSSRGSANHRMADLRVRAAIRPDSAAAKITATIASHQHEFRAVISPSQATLEMRPAQSPDAPWQTMATHNGPLLDPARATPVAFEHVDQSLALVIDGDVVLYAEYDWSPDERLMAATGKDASAFVQGRSLRTNALLNPQTYVHATPRVQWSFEDSPVTLYRVGLDHDIYYRPTYERVHARPGLGTHPKRFATMQEDQFYALGDNSANSKDSRLWSNVHPDYAEQMFDITMEGDRMSEGQYRRALADAAGLIPRDMILGKAFFVYFPAPHALGGKIPVPDTGRIRFIK